jgi:hypothetical protein
MPDGPAIFETSGAWEGLDLQALRPVGAARENEQVPRLVPRAAPATAGLSGGADADRRNLYPIFKVDAECMRVVSAIGDATHWECMKFLRPGITENQVTAHLMKYLYDIPGMEDVEDVIVSSGPNTWPN